MYKKNGIMTLEKLNILQKFFWRICLKVLYIPQNIFVKLFVTEFETRDHTIQESRKLFNVFRDNTKTWVWVTIKVVRIQNNYSSLCVCAVKKKVNLQYCCDLLSRNFKSENIAILT